MSRETRNRPIPPIAPPKPQGKRCNAGDRGPLGKIVRCELDAGHESEHQATSGRITFAWRQ